ncbi:F5/8 type C domain-containing protein [Mycobacteroides abscessus subsp. abscessus]|uniref:discoidin domain-containing protein n=1 Tax=Mycobacteroides abscessus TaxID=36809 RepID=UPI00092B176E|nr:discoidin domain-containing protein [Mycobacteroides abscessus]SIJ21372.1 F5/8 type C domain-containing protein [Mycobacteroides abscessus subsp. abscessus]SLH39115.1 F5/8 type C domain-containing protein [Mycobacteroides abscessus subsp. abscessus]
MSTPTPSELPPDKGWDNRGLLLASLAPRPNTRPARRGTGTSASDDNARPDISSGPGVLRRAASAAGNGGRWAGQRFNKVVPKERRLHAAVITGALFVVLLIVLAGVRFLSVDVSPPVTTAASTPTPPPASRAPINPTTIITGATADDLCPRDDNYSPASNLLDGDPNTAWTCTRVKNQDGQQIRIDFNRQVTLYQVRALCGFDAYAPDGTDQWAKHKVCTKLEIYFPKDLNRDPITLTTDGARDFRPVNIEPPATVSKILIRVAETADPPQSANPRAETTTAAPPGADEVTSVAISDLQFIGTVQPTAPA